MSLHNYFHICLATFLNTLVVFSIYVMIKIYNYAITYASTCAIHDIFLAIRKQ